MEFKTVFAFVGLVTSMGIHFVYGLEYAVESLAVAWFTLLIVTAFREYHPETTHNNTGEKDEKL